MIITPPPPHRVMILFNVGNTQEFICKKSEFGDHPLYFEITDIGNQVKQIPTQYIRGISYESVYLS